MAGSVLVCATHIIQPYVTVDHSIRPGFHLRRKYKRKHKYALLTKREVKMAGYWQVLFFFCVSYSYSFLFFTQSNLPIQLTFIVAETKFSLHQDDSILFLFL